MIVVVCVRSKQLPQMPLTKYDNMVKAFSSDRADEPLTIAILPWRSRRGWPIPNAHCPKTPDEDITVDAIAIANEIAWPTAPSHKPPTVGDLSIRRLGVWLHQATGFHAGHAEGLAPRIIAETRSLGPRTGRSTQYRQHGCEEMSSILGTEVASPEPYTWQPSSARYRCQA